MLMSMQTRMQMRMRSQARSMLLLCTLLFAACTADERSKAAGDDDVAAERISPDSARVPAADTGSGARPVATSPGTSAAPAATTPAATSAAMPIATPATPRRVIVEGVDLTGVGYDRGRAEAPVTIVEFSDFGCPFCGSHARQIFPSLDREYIATGKVYYKYVPFVMGMFPNGRQAARAAECAAEQGRFWTMHDTLYARQAEWKKSLTPFEVLSAYAGQARIDVERFRRCYLQHEPFHPRTRVATDRAEELGVRVTPSFVIDGRAIEGALPLPQFRELLDGLLKP